MSNPEQIPRAQRALIDLNDQFRATQELSLQPVRLEQNPENALAVAHALHLSTYEFPQAFGTGYRKFSVDNLTASFLNRDVTTFGIGQGTLLQAGVSIYMQRPSVGSWSMSFDHAISPNIEFLFKHKAQRDLQVGRSLASTALEHLLDRGCDEVSLSVTSTNSAMRRAYERFGFCVTGQHCSNGFKLIKMKLEGRDALAAAHHKLTNQ